MRSLADLLTQFSLTRDETLRLGISVCRSLIRCRDFGYIYPNLKPENILFDRKGVCKLGDFGSFSCLEPSKSSIAYKRTQYYAAPEYIATDKINCTVDTYSLGLVLYTLINRGRLPFTEPYPQALTIGSYDRSRENRIAGIAFPQPALPDEDLCRIIGKACALKPEDRYLSPKQMLQDLESALAHQPFGLMEFEDVYSVSDNVPAQSDDLSYDPAAYVPPAPPEPAQPDPVAEEPPAPLNLREEIPIPETAPSGATEPDGPAQDEYITPVVPSKPQRKTQQKLFSGKFLIAVLLVVLLLALLVYSVFVRLKGTEPETTVPAEAIAAIMPLQGGYAYGL